MEGTPLLHVPRNERRLGGLAGAGVRFFVLDSRALDPEQLAWLQCRAGRSRERPGRSATSTTRSTRRAATRPAARGAARWRSSRSSSTGDVDVVLVSGHEHFYERIVPQHGISYFISGGAGSLRKGDIRPSALTARGFDTDYHFMLMEVSGDTLYFQAISRTGETVDAGVISAARQRMNGA